MVAQDAKSIGRTHAAVSDRLALDGLTAEKRDLAPAVRIQRVEDRVIVEGLDVTRLAKADVRVERAVVAGEDDPLIPLAERLLDGVEPGLAAGGAERVPR